MVAQAYLDQPQRTDDVLGGGEVFAGGSGTPLGWLWQSTTLSVPPRSAAETTSFTSRLTIRLFPSLSQYTLFTRLRLSSERSRAFSCFARQSGVSGKPPAAQ